MVDSDQSSRALHPWVTVAHGQRLRQARASASRTARPIPLAGDEVPAGGTAPNKHVRGIGRNDRRPARRRRRTDVVGIEQVGGVDADVRVVGVSGRIQTLDHADEGAAQRGGEDHVRGASARAQSTVRV